jgi:hypothetical protein
MTTTARNTKGRSTPGVTEELQSVDHGKLPGSRESGEVAKGVERDLSRLPPDLATSGLAASALCLARSMDEPGSSPTSRSMCANALRDTLDRLLELAPENDESDELDDLASRRAKRLAGGATSSA